MNKNKIDAIHNFFSSVEKLQELGIIKSSKYLGDIGEFLASNKLDLTLVESQRQENYDAIKDNQKYQIKFHNANVGTNINVGDPNYYDYLVVVIGPNSKIRENDHCNTEFRLYKFASKDVMDWGKIKQGKYYCAKAQLKNSNNKISI